MLILASGYFYISSLQDDNAALRATIEASKAIARQQVAENALKFKSAQITAATHKASYEAEIKLRDLDRVKLKKGLENEKANISAMLDDAYKLRLDSISSRTSSKVSNSTDLPASERSDSNTITIITEACRLTTIDYNTLHQAWTDNCKIFGCE
jgi:plasmid stability protein